MLIRFDLFSNTKHNAIFGGDMNVTKPQAIMIILLLLVADLIIPFVPIVAGLFAIAILHEPAKKNLISLLEAAWRDE